VKVWDAATGDEVLSFETPGALGNVNWSPDGRYVIAAGAFDTPVVRRVWQSTEELITYAKECCVPRELTSQEREQFGLPP
jgi:WD40 repeat protein